MQYTVKAGDTLSGIGASQGVDWRQISGFRSGNPNLIYPGEVLTIPDKPNTQVSSSPTPTVTSTPVQSPSYSTPSNSGVTPDGIPISSLPPDLVYNGTLDVSNPVKQTKYNQIVAQYRQSNPNVSSPGAVSTPSFSLPAQPTINLQSIYDKAITDSTASVQPQIDAAMGNVTAIQQRIEQKRQALADAEAQINDNPYYSEATRVGRIAKLRDQFNNDISNDNSQLSIAQQGVDSANNKLAQAKADAQVKVNIASSQYNIQSQQYQQNLQLFTTLLSSGALETISGSDIAQIAQSTGMTTSMVQSIVDFTKKKNAPQPTLLTSDDGTNQYVVAVDPKTGNIIQKQVIGKSAPKTTSASGAETTQNVRAQVAQALNTKAGGDGHVAEQVYLAARSQWVAMGYIAADFDKAFSNYINPNYWESYNLVDPDTVKRFRGY